MIQSLPRAASCTAQGHQPVVARRILRGTGVLATIGATAPFVGLFGTVYGLWS